MRRLALAPLLSFACFAATTQTWEMGGYQDFLRGRMEGLSLSSEGKLSLGPAMTTVFDSGQADIWSLAPAPDGSLYLGTGNRGRLFRIDGTGQSSLVWTAAEPEIFAVAVDPKGIVFAATSPDGKVYRIENGKASEYFAPGARYIWALAVAPDGALIVATGDQGKIFRVTAAGQGAVFYETGQSHVTALAFDPQGRLLAGSEPNGLLYRIDAAGKAFVLYDSSLPEIRAIAVAPDGTVYASALGGGVARRVNAAASAISSSAGGALPTFSTSITVTDQQSGITPAPKPEAPKPLAAAAVAAAPVIATTAATDTSGAEKSALYKIWPDNTVETLWSSKDENIYDLTLDGSSIVFLTDLQGRLYRMNAAADGGKTTLMAQTGEGDATRLLASPQGLLAATGSLGKLLRFGQSPGAAGWFESPVHDSGTVARWGHIVWRGAGSGIVFRTRTGNAARPDATWSDWSSPIADPALTPIPSPNGRYIQWRAEFSGTAAADNVTVAYLPRNTPPIVRSISVSGVSVPKASTTTSTTASASSNAYSITVTDAVDTSVSSTPSQTIGRAASQQVLVVWQADDPDGDKLLYNLYFRGEDESQWKLLRADMTENNYTLDADALADGRYLFRVTASDRASNALDQARQAEFISSPVLVDNTPPLVTAGAPRRAGLRLEIDVDAEDRGSVLRRCEYSIDAGPWSPVEAADGITDSARERFSIRLENFPGGEHLVSIRVYDAAGNAGLAKVISR